MSQFLAQSANFLWGTPLVLLLIGGGLYLLFFSHLLPLKGIFHAFKLLFGKSHERNPVGQISHFKALTNALSATIGMGNIAGVAVAIHQGGPGAIFWMWCAALVGMITKFFECTLSLMYRGEDYQGEVQGGPMYVLSKATPQFGFLAYIFSFCALIATVPLFNVNQLATYLESTYSVPQSTLGVILAVTVFYILSGGIQRLANFTSKLVPLMCVLYTLGAIFIILSFPHRIPKVFALILHCAFTGEAFVGGAIGTGVIAIMRIGVRRAAFSNEAGVGTAPMAHGNAQTNYPVREGLVAMLGPFFDTIIVCTLTALVLLITLDGTDLQNSNGLGLISLAFERGIPVFGIPLLSLVIILFSFTTTIGMANYNQKSWNFLFRGRWHMNDTTFKVWFCASIVMATLVTMDDVVNLIDIFYALMCIPNMFITLYLSKKVKKALQDYFKKFPEKIM